MLACLGCGTMPACAEEEIQLGHNAAGQLKVRVDYEQPFALPVSPFPGMPGYATGEVGFHSAALDEPANDFFQVSAAADFRFVLVAKDPGMEVWNDHGSAYMNVGESFLLGTAPFDTHPVWDLVSSAPGQSYSLTLKVRDLNGIYTESDPVVLGFTPVPPVLAIKPAAPGFMTISWAPTGPGLVLQGSRTLAPTGWTNLPSGATNPVTLPVTVPAQFYRVAQ
jgi:hypothetical protein